MIKVSFRTCHFYFKRFNRILLLIRNPANHFLERRFLSIHQDTYPINLSGYPNHAESGNVQNNYRQHRFPHRYIERQTHHHDNR